MGVAMIPAAFLAGGADQMPAHVGRSARPMREVLGEAMRNRPFLVMSGAYFVCGLNLVFLTTHLPAYLAICGQDPMLSGKRLRRSAGRAASAHCSAVGSAGNIRNTFCSDFFTSCVR